MRRGSAVALLLLSVTAATVAAQQPAKKNITTKDMLALPT